MKWVIIKGVRYPSSVISAFAAYNMDNPYETTRNIQERPALYAFKIATAYFREQGLVPVFENSHCKLMRL